MQTQTQIGKTAEEICAHVVGVELPGEFPERAREAVNAIAEVLNRTYDPYVVACARGSELTVDIYNRYIDHIDTCRAACEAAGCDISKCHESCRRVIREDSFKSLLESVKYIKAELALRRFNFSYEFDRGDLPSHIKFIIKL